MLKWPEVKNFDETEYDYFCRVHLWAKSIFTWNTDQATWGKPDYWPTKEDLEELAKQAGIIYEDCDGFAQLCRYAIAMSDFVSRLVVCNRPENPTEHGNHCVAETELGFVFDCSQTVLAVWGNLIGQGYEKKSMGPLCNPNDPYLVADWHKAL